MKKATLYSRSPRRPAPAGSAAPAPSAVPWSRPEDPRHRRQPATAWAVRSDAAAAAAAAAPDPAALAKASARAARRAKLASTRLGRGAAAVQRTLQRWQMPLWALAGAVLAVMAMQLMQRTAPALTQDDIDAAVRESIEREPLPSQAAKAYEAILPSVVRVIGLMEDNDEGEERGSGSSSSGEGGKSPEKRAMERSLGSGVVIVDNGTILTNLHVVWGAKKIRVRFANGHVSEAKMISAQPENDLAVLKASSLPDDLEAATMRSTADLRPGDHVIAVGYPFGIGPSVSYGVVSGLKREFRTPESDKPGEASSDGGRRKTLSNLIQFDAAANPGNSGGPLVTMDGAVVGIVTAILNPSEQRTFIGIGFAVPIENAAGAVGMHPF
jgi:S1-C subfamily serine protease